MRLSYPIKGKTVKKHKAKFSIIQNYKNKINSN